MSIPIQASYQFRHSLHHVLTMRIDIFHCSYFLRIQLILHFLLMNMKGLQDLSNSTISVHNILHHRYLMVHNDHEVKMNPKNFEYYSTLILSVEMYLLMHYISSYNLGHYASLLEILCHSPTLFQSFSVKDSISSYH